MQSEYLVACHLAGETPSTHDYPPTPASARSKGDILMITGQPEEAREAWEQGVSPRALDRARYGNLEATVEELMGVRVGVRHS